MTIWLQNRLGNQRQRGFWLRYFLGLAVLVVPTVVAPVASGQADCFSKTLSVAEVEGQVVDPSGVPIPNAELSLTRNSDMAIFDTTDSSGNFSFSTPDGEFWISASALGFAPMKTAVHVRKGPARGSDPSPLVLILGVGIFQPCPPATTSRKELTRIIHDFNRRIQQSNSNAAWN